MAKLEVCHPETGETLEHLDDPQEVQRFINDYKAAASQAAQWQQIEAKYRQVFLAMAAAPEGGKPKVVGLDDVVVVNPRVNVSYPREKGAVHPLKSLVEAYPFLEDMVKVDYDERGRGIAELLARVSDGRGSEAERTAAAAIEALRLVKQGKPEIEIKPARASDCIEPGATSEVEYHT